MIDRWTHVNKQKIFWFLNIFINFTYVLMNNFHICDKKILQDINAVTSLRYLNIVYL